MGIGKCGPQMWDRGKAHAREEALDPEAENNLLQTQTMGRFLRLDPSYDEGAVGTNNRTSTGPRARID